MAFAEEDEREWWRAKMGPGWSLLIAGASAHDSLEGPYMAAAGPDL